jgi:hypothetical protein
MCGRGIIYMYCRKRADKQAMYKKDYSDENSDATSPLKHDFCYFEMSRRWNQLMPTLKPITIPHTISIKSPINHNSF